jgi:hypothetical protein
MTTKWKWDNYQFTSRRELHVYSLRARLSPHLWRLICRCDWRSCRNRGGILDVSRKFRRKFSAALGFWSSVIAFLSGLIMTMTWLHFSVPMDLNVNVSSFLLMLSFMILAAAAIMAPIVLKNASQEWAVSNDRHSFWVPQSPQARMNSWFSLRYLPRFPLDTRSIDPPATYVGK